MSGRQKTPLYKTLSKTDEETVSAFEVVQRVVNIVLSAISEYDVRFSFSPVGKSSFLVVKGPAHFEILVTLKHLDSPQLELEEEGLPPGITLVHVLEESTLAKWRSQCGHSPNGRESLSVKLVCCSLSKLISMLIEDIGSFRSRNGLAEDICIANTSSEDVVSINIKLRSSSYTVELVPAIECTGLWPLCAHEWGNSTTSHWPNLLTKQEIIDGGIHLVAKQGKNDFHWRIWFCKAERNLLKFKKMAPKGKCLTAMKKVVFGKLACSFLSSYHLQTIMLHESVRLPNDSQWTIDKVGERLVSLLQSLVSFLRDRKCPHFFLSSLNLFQGIDGIVLESFAEKVQQIVEDPAELLGEMLTSRLSLDASSIKETDEEDSAQDTRL